MHGMNIEIFDSLKRKRDICVKSIITSRLSRLTPKNMAMSMKNSIFVKNILKRKKSRETVVVVEVMAVAVELVVVMVEVVVAVVAAVVVEVVEVLVVAVGEVVVVVVMVAAVVVVVNVVAVLVVVVVLIVEVVVVHTNKASSSL